MCESYGVVLYDMSIPDIEERKEKKLVFDKAVKAANFLGMVPGKFYERIGIGKYAKHKTTGVKYAVRKINPMKIDKLNENAKK